MVVKVAVTKESRDDHVGVVLEEKQGSSGDTRIVVSSIGYHSLFANTRLRAGMEILSINDKSVQSASNATKLLQDAQDFVELVAIDPSASMAVGSDPAPIQRRRSTDPDSGGVSYGNQDATLIDSAAPPPIRPSSSHGRGSYKPDPDGETGQSIRESQKRASHKSSSSHNKAPSAPRKQNNKSSRDPTMISSPPPSSPRKSTNTRRSSRDPTMIQAPVPAPAPPPPPPQDDDEESFEEETFLTTATPVDYNDQAYASVPVVAASAVGHSGGARSQNQPDGSVKVTATKPSQDSPVGIHLRQSGNEIVIDSISAQSIFQGSALRSGMVLLSINGCECAGMTPDFANILLQTSSADVSIVAKENSSHRASSSNNNSNGKIISVTATKASRDSRVGIAMRRKDGIGFCVDSIAPTSIFANTELQQGMKVLTINGVSIQQSMSSQQVLSLLVNAESKVTIVAEKVNNNGAAAMRNSSTSNNHHGSNHNSVNNHGNNVSVTVTKPTPSSRVGISIKRYDGIGFVVESIAPGSLFEPTELKKGMKVLSINGVPIQLSMQSEEVLVLLTSAPSNVTIVAERTNHRSSHNSSHMNTSSSSSPSSPYVTVSAMKPTPNSRVGVAMKRHEGIGFLVESISPGSLFATTELKAGMKIISINGTTVETQMQSQQVLSLLTTAPSLVTIVAERVSSSNKPPPAMMVSVTAPSDLMEGYQFDAQMNGRNFKVTVPSGGVRAGQQFQVPAPTEADFQRFSNTTAPGAVNKPSANGTGAPVGQFRNDMCSCFETCPCPTLMGLCCMGILAGQVLQRLKLGPCGTPGDYENTCVIMTAIFVVFAVLTGILFASTSIGYYIYMVFNVYMIVALTCARKHMRERYNIPGAMCGDSCLDDCCCAYWCGCCTVIQMHRHTHDEKQYPYEISSKTGLAANAPEIV